MSVNRLARKMVILVREVERENEDRCSPKEGRRARPPLPIPELGSTFSCADYAVLLRSDGHREIDAVLSHVESVSKSLRKAGASEVRLAWDLAMAQLVMEG